MTQKPDNPPAFPHSLKYHGADTVEKMTHGGMTLRDYFAAAALQGECAAQDNVHMGIAVNGVDYLKSAHRAYKFADAMLKAREATND